MDWTQLLPPVIGGLLALSGGAVTTWLQGNTQQRLERERQQERAAEERNRRKERAADVLGDTVRLVDQAAPRRLAYQGRPAHQVEEPVLEQRAAVYPQLLRLAIGHPSSHVLQLTRDLDDALLHSLFATVAWIQARDAMQPDEQQQQALRRVAFEAHDRATELLQQLLDEV